MSTTLSLWLACVMVVLIVVLCTGSLQMAVLILINLMIIVVFVVAGLAYIGMEFGGIEAIALTVLIGAPRIGVAQIGFVWVFHPRQVSASGGAMVVQPSAIIGVVTRMMSCYQRMHQV